MKNKKVFIILGIIIFLLLCYLGYKSFLLYYLNQTNKEYQNIYKEIIDLPINRNVSYQNDTFDNLKYYVPSWLIFKEITNGQKVYIENDNNGNMIGQLTIGLANSKFLEDTKNSLKFINYEKLAKKYNINDEIDLYHYYYEHKNEKRSIFWSNSHLEMELFVNVYMFLASTGDLNSNSYFLSGDLKGFMVEFNGTYLAYFMHENENYILSYVGKTGNLMSHEEFTKILESISFE